MGTIRPKSDRRGLVFLCLFCATMFAECGPNSTVAQMKTSFNYTRGTLRGLHRQMPSYAEAKLVRCTRGAIVDVEVRPKSQTVCRTRLPDARPTRRKSSARSAVVASPPG